MAIGRLVVSDFATSSIIGMKQTAAKAKEARRFRDGRRERASTKFVQIFCRPRLRLGVLMGHAQTHLKPLVSIASDMIIIILNIVLTIIIIIPTQQTAPLENILQC